MRFLEKLSPLSQLVLRWALAAIFMSHGYPKLFSQTANWLQAFSRMGFPSYFAYVAGVIEFFGGCLLIPGLFTRPVALMLAIEMCVALVGVHMKQGIYAVSHYEFPLALAAAAFALATIGAGVLSLDYPIFEAKSRSRGRSKSKD